MSLYRQSIQDYIHACEALLKVSDLSVDEQEALERMMSRLQENLGSGNDTG